MCCAETNHTMQIANVHDAGKCSKCDEKWIKWKDEKSVYFCDYIKKIVHNMP